MKKSELTEVSYLVAKEELKSTFISMIIGFIIGAVLAWVVTMGSSESSGRIMMMVFIGLVLSGTPYVWKHFPYIALGWLSLLIKLVVSVCLGWIITPITLIYHWIEVKVYEGKIRRQQKQEYTEEAKADGDSKS